MPTAIFQATTVTCPECDHINVEPSYMDWTVIVCQCGAELENPDMEPLGPPERSICYVCQVEDANETPFDENQHRLCLLCARKLEVMADTGVVWENPQQGKVYRLTCAEGPGMDLHDPYNTPYNSSTGSHMFACDNLCFSSTPPPLDDDD